MDMVLYGIPKLACSMPSVSIVVLMLVVVIGTSCQPSEIFRNPPPTLESADLVGTWQVQYASKTLDRFTLRTDGTFKQQYKNDPESYSYETGWNPWSMRKHTDGRVRVYLQGARYYPDGIYWAQQEGLLNSASGVTMPFLDPVANELVEMPHLVILNVQSDSSGSLVLIQMMFGVEGKSITGAAKLHRVAGQ